MGSFVETRGRTFQATSALARARQVKLSAGKLVYAGASDYGIGILRDAVFAADEYGTVDLWTLQGTVPCTAAGAISQYDTVYSAANGKIASTGTVVVGKAMQAASGDGSIIEVLPYEKGNSVARASLVQDDLKPFSVPLTDAVVKTTGQRLASSAKTGQFSISFGTVGSTSPKLVGNTANNAAVTDYLAVLCPLPTPYVDGESVTVRLKARITGNVAVSQTIDVNAYESDGAGGYSADLCATAAQALTATFANYDFTITPTALAAGDMLCVQVVGVADDTGGSAGKAIEIGAIQLLCDIKG